MILQMAKEIQDPFKQNHEQIEGNAEKAYVHRQSSNCFAHVYGLNY